VKQPRDLRQAPRLGATRFSKGDRAKIQPPCKTLKGREEWRIKKRKKEGKREKEKAYQFEDNKEQIIDNKRPLATVAITRDTENNGADRSKHENEGDAPGNIRLGLAKLVGEIGHGQGNGEKVKRVPGLAEAKKLAAMKPRLLLAELG
jgi:hypothetical protein